MHNAPAVSYPVGRSHLEGALIGLAGLVGAVTGLLWYMQTDLVGWRQWLFVMALVGVVLSAAQAWRRTPRGRLRWDGQVWSWSHGDATTSGELTAHLDLQFCLLLSLRPDRGARFWLWPEQRVAMAHWRSLRRAVFAKGLEAKKSSFM